MAMRYYGHWRSLATYRLRVALVLKAIEAEFVPIDLLGKEHLGQRYRAINPQGMLPALEDGEGPVLFQSLAIIEYLDERFPEHPLLPTNPRDRARVRGIAQIIAADAHPLIVPRVRDYLQNQLHASEEEKRAWIAYFGNAALASIEGVLTCDPRRGRFCHGDAPGFADIALVSHVIGMSLFSLSTAAYPKIQAIYSACMALPAFADAHPLRQTGAAENQCA